MQRKRRKKKRFGVFLLLLVVCIGIGIMLSLIHILLDIMLPDIDGFRLCQKIREKFYFPIIMVLQRREFVMRRSLYFRSILFEIFGQILMYQFQLFYFLLKRNILSI